MQRLRCTSKSKVNVSKQLQHTKATHFRKVGVSDSLKKLRDFIYSNPVRYYNIKIQLVGYPALSSQTLWPHSPSIGMKEHLKTSFMTLMTTDVDRVSEFAWHNFSLIGMSDSTQYDPGYYHAFILDSPIEIVIGAIFLYKLLGT